MNLSPVSTPDTSPPSQLNGPSGSWLAGWGLLRVSGADAANFLQGQCTADIQSLTHGSLGCGAFCTPKGRVFANVRLARWENDFYLMLPRELVAPLQKRLQLYVLRAKVVIEDLTGDQSMLGMLGPNADDTLRNTGFQMPDKGRFTPPGGGNGPAILCLPDDANRFILMFADNRDSAMGFTQSIAFVPSETWQLSEIAAGFPWVTLATSEEFLPQMINLDRLDGIGFNKGCYTGQEIVTRTHYLGQLKRRMFRLQGQGSLCPTPGALIYDVNGTEPKSVGHVLNACPIDSERFECLAVFALEQADNLTLRAGDPNGPLLEKLPLPYSLTDKAGHS